MPPFVPHRTVALSGLAFLAASGGAFAQSSDAPTRAIETQILAGDGEPRCQPQELRLPADANIDLRIQNGGRRAILVRAPDLFADGRVRSAAGAANETTGGYRVEAGGTAQIIVKTPPQGQYRYECADPVGGGPVMGGTLSVVR